MRLAGSPSEASSGSQLPLHHDTQHWCTTNRTAVPPADPAGLAFLQQTCSRPSWASSCPSSSSWGASTCVQCRCGTPVHGVVRQRLCKQTPLNATCMRVSRVCGCHVYSRSKPLSLEGGAEGYHPYISPCLCLCVCVAIALTATAKGAGGPTPLPAGPLSLLVHGPFG